MEQKFDADKLIAFAQKVLEKVGLQSAAATVVARTLVEGDLMGHNTHGLQLLSAYVSELEAGKMSKKGEAIVLNDLGAAITWDGNYLPGPWLVHQAMDLAFERISQHPVVTVVIRRSHHIGCLAAYPERATEKGLVMMLSCSDPNTRTVAPFGGVSPVYSPNPLAMGIPTATEPIIFDVSMSATANGYVNRAKEEGRKLPHPWLLENSGSVTDNPAAFFDSPPATILPIGGLDSGYKGFALGLMIEALTSALGGHGRADEPGRWGANVFLQIINPGAFGGLASFQREMEYLSDQCIASERREEASEVRLPGRRALKLRNQQRETGLELYPGIIPALQNLAAKYQIPLPTPL
ncbi:Ldh family oxidoreductase [Pedobacter sp. SYSU D00535]|uniref:Ldh family oxidoreductase n=1 Tax=Pedobacter sp. SYSU D00535 TaxID=2810308 RepID=UPI001A975460|nr:Ldh family oxidoreductase [Pedobacter sp. SYSU D00535]